MLTLVLVVLVGGCAAVDDASPTSATPAGNTATTRAESAPATGAESYDPFQEFIALGGAELWAQDADSCVVLPVMCGSVCCSLVSEDISPEDAQTRALLGCETEWPAGTIDALLAEAYRQVDGFCA
jgi:hypothetical protein